MEPPESAPVHNSVETGSGHLGQPGHIFSGSSHSTHISSFQAPISLTTSSSTTNAYRFSFFINSPFLWNSVPVEILQISKAIPFRMALRRFLLS